ncbi:MAG: hypothetical protein LVS60_18685 [Nodosilinea sp. LVE1205-7]
MVRLKRSSQILEKAERRAAGLKSIDPSLNLGNGLSLRSYCRLMDRLREQIADYNETLALADRANRSVRDGEQKLRELSERMLIAVAARYGKDSPEYEMAGGTRRSNRKRPHRRGEIAA